MIYSIFECISIAILINLLLSFTSLPRCIRLDLPILGTRPLYSRRNNRIYSYNLRLVIWIASCNSVLLGNIIALKESIYNPFDDNRFVSDNRVEVIVCSIESGGRRDVIRPTASFELKSCEPDVNTRISIDQSIISLIPLLFVSSFRVLVSCLVECKPKYKAIPATKNEEITPAIVHTLVDTLTSIDMVRLYHLKVRIRNDADNLW